jgi:hypothetical protein
VAVLYENTAYVRFAFLVGDSVFFVCEDPNKLLITVIRGRLNPQGQ